MNSAKNRRNALLRKSLDSLIEAEQSIVKVYFKRIDDSIANWQAVEEDFIESYTKMTETASSQEIKNEIMKVIEDSRRHIQTLKATSEIVQSILEDEVKHRMLLLALRNQTRTDPS